MMNKLSKVKSIRPVMSQVLFEKLSAQETADTQFYINEKSDMGAPQGVIVAMGPCLKPDDLGFKVGDRVLLVGNYTPCPIKSDNGRDLGLTEIHAIKAVLECEAK